MNLNINQLFRSLCRPVAFYRIT